MLVHIMLQALQGQILYVITPYQTHIIYINNHKICCFL